MLRDRFDAYAEKGAVVQHNYSVGQHGIIRERENQNKQLFEAIEYYIQSKKVYSDSMECLMYKAFYQKSFDAESNIIMRPTNKVSIDGVDIMFSRTTSNSTEKKSSTEIKEKYVITSNLGSEYIRQFIMNCANTYKPVARNEIGPNRVAVLVKLQDDQDQQIVFDIYENSSTLIFDDIFFPEKQNVISSLNKYMSRTKQMKKLSMLLHGKPGCGKSSIIKAIANYTGYTVFVIKLSYIDSDEDLMNLFHESSIYMYGGDSVYVPSNKRIYIFEDVDAESDIVLRKRKLVESPSISDMLWNGDEPTEDKGPKKKKASAETSKLTLSGVLNSLDGLMELNSIIIMTTNHPENLDPAMTRYGRFTLKVELDAMLAVHAHELIKYNIPEYDGTFDIPDRFITPAALQSYISTCFDLNHLQKLISEHEPDSV